MVQPMLFLGLGGAGGKTIRSLIQSLERELLSIGYTAGIPDAWQFLHLDVARDGISFPAPMLSEDRFLPLVPAGTNYANMVARLTNLGVNTEQQEMLAGWAIPASAINIGMGAGQVRAIGRLVGLASADFIKNGIEQKILTMSSAQALSQLAELSKVMNLGIPNSTPKAFIFTSLTGGLGSGIYSDVKEILSSTSNSPWVSNPTSFLYTAEVFESIGPYHSHIASNVLGAVNEVVSDKFNSKSQASEVLYNKLGLPSSNRSSHRGPRRGTEFLIGSRNKSGQDISLGPANSGMDQAFKVVGESIASLLTKDELAVWLERILHVSSDHKFVQDWSGLAPMGQNSAGMGGFSGVGFCKLTVGTEYLLDYVADALTREQVRTLLWPDLDFDFKEGDPTRETLVKNQSADTFKFLLPSDEDGELGFNEHFRNSMISQSLQKQIAESCFMFMDKNVSGKPQELLKFSRNLSLSWMNENQSILSDCKREISANAAQWVLETQETLLGKISQCLSTGGFASLIDALSRLIQTFDDEYLPFTRREESEFDAVLGRLQPEDLYHRIIEISDGLTAISRSNSATLTNIEKSVRRVVQMSVEHYALSVCAEVLSDLSENFLSPVLNSLIDSRFELQSSIKEGDNSSWGTHRFAVFPEWGSLKVPGEYKPETAERTLIDPISFEHMYEAYSEHANDDRSAFTQSIRAAFLGADLVQGLSSGTYQGLIHGEKWVSGVREAQIRLDQVAQKATLRFQTDLFSLGQRNRRWLQERNSSFGKLLAMSISEFVEEKGIDPSVSDRRTKDFLYSFTALAHLSLPLMLINSQALASIATSDSHSLDVPHLQVSKIPFDQNSQIGSICLGILGSLGVDILNSGVANSLFDSQSKTRSLMAVSVTRGNLPYWAISSITEPSLRKIAVSRDSAAAWQNFWEGRRALPLLDSIPLESEIRRSIITGWFISALFGMRKIEVGPVGRSALILNPYSSPEKWASLPSPLLENGVVDFSHPNWLLPGILSSVSIALSEFGKTGNSEKIEAYLLLKHLGREVTTTIRNRDSWDIFGVGDLLPNSSPQMSKFISEWIRGGILPNEASRLVPMLQEKIDSGMCNRDALIEVVNTLRSEYRSNWIENTETAWFKMPQTWELKEDLDLAFKDICNYVQGIEP